MTLLLKVTHIFLPVAKPKRKKARRVDSTFLGKHAEDQQEKQSRAAAIKAKVNLSAYGTYTLL